MYPISKSELSKAYGHMYWDMLTSSVSTPSPEDKPTAKNGQSHAVPVEANEVYPC